MQLHDPNATPFDLRFRLFGTDVRVTPWFWLFSALLGWRGPDRAVLPGNGLGDVLVWIACAFVSILLHEFGHIWMGRVFGAQGYIILQGFGGLAVGSAEVPYRWQRILVSAAGPAIQLVLYAILYGLLWVGAFSFLIPADSVASKAALLTLRDLMWINLAWPILNLLPIWPLDGGWITRDTFGMVSPRGGLLASLWVSLVTAAVLAVVAGMWEFQRERMVGFYLRINEYSTWLARAFVEFRGIYLAVLFALLAIGSWQAILAAKASGRRYWEADDNVPWER